MIKFWDLCQQKIFECSLIILNVTSSVWHKKYSLFTLMEDPLIASIQYINSQRLYIFLVVVLCFSFPLTMAKQTHYANAFNHTSIFYVHI